MISCLSLESLLFKIKTCLRFIPCNGIIYKIMLINITYIFITLTSLCTVLSSHLVPVPVLQQSLTGIMAITWTLMSTKLLVHLLYTLPKYRSLIGILNQNLVIEINKIKECCETENTLIRKQNIMVVGRMNFRVRHN